MKSQLTTGNLESLTSFPPCLEEGEQISITTTTGPLIQTSWGQGNGYNDNLTSMSCSIPSNGKPPTGCVATSIAQVMYYHQYPQAFMTGVIPYMPSTTAVMMANIGAEVNMSYGCDGSGAYSSLTDNAFSHYGYSSANYASYNNNTVRNDIVNGRPVILAGADESSGWWFFNSSGHQWIADGVKETIVYQCRLDWGPVESRGLPPDPGEGFWFEAYGILYFNMNWGWDGNYNDWYAFNTFNVNGSMYDAGLKMITNIHP
ncbi:MAG: hypothetical protein EOO91_12025 [Pedobacter sp.]|nr:MAG: hypothetical protein EOO91_12025 [Pedobacter sp.]